MHSLFTSPTSLKVCGITTESDLVGLIDHGVEALGFNFWPQSKRYIEPSSAAKFSPDYAGKILRVGVFVNAVQAEVFSLLDEGVIDVAQLYGDESVEYCQAFVQRGYAFIKAIGVKNSGSLEHVADYGATAILLDAHAPDVYGGTGDTFDWNLALRVMEVNPHLPIMLAGGITAENAAEATLRVRPCALDVASGAESSPGVKDFTKVAALVAAVESAR